jgi:hypothetical protein
MFFDEMFDIACDAIILRGLLHADKAKTIEEV